VHPRLGGEPDFSPQGLLGRSHTQYVEGESLIGMIREDLVAEHPVRLLEELGEER
jgi:bacterioferritin